MDAVAKTKIPIRLESSSHSAVVHAVAWLLQLLAGYMAHFMACSPTNFHGYKIM